MIEKIFKTRCGDIHYWINALYPDRQTLVMLMDKAEWLHAILETEGIKRPIFVGHGYGMLADAIEADLPYDIDCHCILICGDKDKAGDTKSFNRRWAKGEGLPIHWIAGAGHNSNTDKPEEINEIIKSFIYNK